MPVNLLQDVSVTSGAIHLKFSVTIDIDTLVDSNFVLMLDGATPSEVSGAFKSIDITRDYDSISRVLKLYLESALTPETDYILRISDLKTPYQETLSDVDFLFTTGTTTVISPSDQVPVTPEVVIEDSSIRDFTLAELNLAVINSGGSVFRIVNFDPGEEDAFYMPASYNEGRIEITFSSPVADNFISNEFFKVQKKLVGRGMARWQDVPIIITASTDYSTIILYLPSTDATPIYSGSGLTYWEPGYKYRVRVSSLVGSISDII